MTMNWWRDYRLWNDAICERYFGTDFSHIPVYLDIDDVMLEEVHDSAGWPDESAPSPFLETVTSLLNMSQITHGGDFLKFHLDKTRLWKQAPQESYPPFIGVLAFLSYAAYQMSSTAKYSANNYYTPLYMMIYGDEPSPRELAQLRNSYSRGVPYLWDMLEWWLEEVKHGLFGLHTARPTDRRVYIGYALSQAILRSHDRIKLSECFSFARLRAGDELAIDDMLGILRQWVPRSSLSGVALEIWKRGADHQAAFAAIALAELSAWDGGSYKSLDSEGESGRKTHGLMLLMDKEVGPGRPTVSFSLGFTAREGPTEDIYQVTEGSGIIYGQASGDRLDSMTFMLAEPGLWQNLETPSISDLLVSRIELESATIGRRIERSPSRVVVFQFDDLSRRFVDTNKTTIGKRICILAHRSAESKVRSLIDPSLLPGTEIVLWDHTTMRGIPEDWILFDEILLVSRVSNPGGAADDEYDVLETTGSDIRIHLDGGLKIPGQEDWLISHPPSLSFVLEPESEDVVLELALRLASDDTRSTSIPIETGSGGLKTVNMSVFPVSLDSFKLTLAFTVGKARTQRSLNLSFCSADEPRFSGASPEIIGDKVLDPRYPPFEYSPYDPARISLTSESADSNLIPEELPTALSIEPEMPMVPEQVVLWGEGAECFLTSAHKSTLPPNEPGKNVAVSAPCEYCGILRRGDRFKWGNVKR